MTATSAIIPASGLGTRLASDVDKAFVPVAGLPLIVHTLAVFQECPEIDEIVLVVREEMLPAATELLREHSLSKVASVVPGGVERSDSVRRGLAAVSPVSQVIAIHDGARPLVTREIIAATVEAARVHGAAVAAVPVIDTIKVSDGEFVQTTLDRSKLYAVQTPQTFRREIIEKAYAHADGGTDDASLVERLGLPVRIVPGSYQNFKVTTPTDITLAEALMSEKNTYRIGHGYDIHRFEAGRKLFLGGVEFEGEGLAGHSDADALLHAVADAVLGAAGAGDIGRHFPDTDPAYKGARSIMLLARVREIVTEFGWRVENVDVTLVAERPRIAGRADEMKANIAEALRIRPEDVGIKATTAESLGAIGEGLGIECHAVALLSR
ncbi:MAG: 2-C-methyl-D-erythritol 4-phosphate cytidylyltransferase [Armatimonadota bacterium]